MNTASYEQLFLKNLASIKADHAHRMRCLDETRPGGPRTGDEDEKNKNRREQLRKSEIASYVATHNAICAFERLLLRAECLQNDHVEHVVNFLAAVWGVTRGVEVAGLVTVDEDVGSDMLDVLNGIRWMRWSASDMAVDARRRVPQLLRKWGFENF
jgi:hypothetical protein